MKPSREQIIDLINEYIYTNGRQRITANQLNELLTLIANSFELLGQGTGGGINAVLEIDPTVDDNKKIINRNGGHFELSGKIHLSDEFSAPYIGFLTTQENKDDPRSFNVAPDNPKIGGVVSNQWTTVIGNIDGLNPFNPNNNKSFSPLIQNFARKPQENTLRAEAEKRDSRTATASIYLPNDFYYGDTYVPRGVYTGIVQDENQNYIRIVQDELELTVRNESHYDDGSETRKGSIYMTDYSISQKVKSGKGFSKEMLETSRKCFEFDDQEVLEINNKGLTFKSDKRISYVSGSETAGIAVLTAGQVTVSTSAMSDYSYIMLTVQDTGDFQGNIRVSSKTSSGFTISSSDNTDNCSVLWQVIDIL